MFACVKGGSGKFQTLREQTALSNVINQRLLSNAKILSNLNMTFYK